MKIKPDMLCMVIGDLGEGGERNAIVKTIEYLGDVVTMEPVYAEGVCISKGIVVPDAWAVEARSGWADVITTKNLRPVHDPDEDLSHETEDERETV